MNAAKILQSVGLKPSDKIVSINNKDAIENLLNFIKEWELPIEVEKINKQDWETILGSYADAIITYHPENDHQERATFLRNEKICKKYGLTDEDVIRLNFC